MADSLIHASTAHAQLVTCHRCADAAEGRCGTNNAYVGLRFAGLAFFVNMLARSSVTTLLLQWRKMPSTDMPSATIKTQLPQNNILQHASTASPPTHSVSISTSQKAGSKKPSLRLPGAHTPLPPAAQLWWQQHARLGSHARPSCCVLLAGLGLAGSFGK